MHTLWLFTPLNQENVMRLFALSLAFVAHAFPALAGQVRVFTSDAAGFNTHSVWYDDGKEITVVDTQFTPAVAEALVAQIKRQSTSPITRVIVTHPSPDKFNALSVFHRLGAVSISSEKTAAAIPGVDAYKRHFWTKIAKSFTDETYPKVEPIKETFSGSKTIRLASGETLTLVELEKPGVASNQIVVRIDATGDLIVGDLVAHEAHAWLEGGIVGGKATPNLAGWKADLKKVGTLGKGTLYGGRGKFAPVAKAISAQIAYLDKAEAIVAKYLKNLGPKTSELSDPAKSGAHFAALQAEFVKAFPTYAHPELVGYSVYGLALSMAARRTCAASPCTPPRAWSTAARTSG